MTRSFQITIAVCLFLVGAAAFARHADDARKTEAHRIARADKSADDPDELYRQREDLASVISAASLWDAAAATDYEAAWKLARAAYWIGTHAPESERRAALERGVSAGEIAIRLQPDRPEGHFWLAVNMGSLAESFGLSQGLKYRSRIKSELERAMAIDPSWEEASAETVLGQWYAKVPRLFGGSRVKAEERFHHVLERFPHSKNASWFLAGLLIAQGRTAESRPLLQRVIETPIEPAWAPEDRELNRKAAERLRALGPGDGKP